MWPKFTAVFPEPVTPVCFVLLTQSHSVTQSFYLYPSPHALASGPNLDETNGGNLDKCTDETNNYLVPEGSFFPEGW